MIKKQYRIVTITPGLQGFEVQCGCAKIFYDDIHQMLIDIGCYYDDPQRIEKEFLEQDQRMSGGVPGCVDYNSYARQQLSAAQYIPGMSASSGDRPTAVASG